MIGTESVDISCSAEIYTVSQLNREARLLLEKNFKTLWVEGEVSNFVVPSSGHWYFSLKDKSSQVRCAMFRVQNKALAWLPKDGTHVLVKVRVSLYEGRGDYQLIVGHMEDIGLGRLRQAFEELKKKLEQKGFFADKYKKKLPAYPKCIGVVTSNTGAAIQDILSVLARRYPLAPVIVYETQVQGELAAAAIVKALHLANKKKQCDVIILSRGGGSLEDLWPFNEEVVAAAIYQSAIPIVTGVGHETDFTIADFVADLRAPTPSVAAESITPDWHEIIKKLKQLDKQLCKKLNFVLQNIQQKLDWSEKLLRQQHPKARLEEIKRRLKKHKKDLVSIQNRKIFHYQQQVFTVAAKLDALNPLAVLNRGFSVAKKLPEKILLKSTAQVKLKDQILVRLKEGELLCTVDEISNA